MTPGWKSIFGKSPEKLKDQAIRLAEMERWSEAVDLLEDAARRTSDEGDPIRFEIDRLIREYSDAYRRFLIEAIPNLFEDENREKALELAEIAISFCKDSTEEEEIRELVKAHPRIDVSRFEPPPKPNKYPPELIDSLLQGYLDLTDPVERRAVEERPLVFQRAFVLWHQGEAKDALESAEEFLLKRIDDPWGLLYTGLSLLSLGEEEKAVPVFETTLEREPTMIRAAIALAGLEKHRDNDARARELMERAVALVQSDLESYGETRREEVFEITLTIIMETGDLDAAEEMYIDLREKGLLKEDLVFEARIHEARGNHDEAAEAWNALVGTNAMSGSIMGHSSSSNVSFTTYEEAGDFFERQAKLKRALNLYRQAALLFTQRVHYSDDRLPMEILHNLKMKIASLLMEMEQWSEAEGLVLEMEQLDPPPPGVEALRKRLGDSWEEEGE